MYVRIVIFLVINFLALGIGSLFTSKGVPSDWYQNLNKAPWTPPGWMFGAAWTTIMICFSVYMAYAWNMVTNRDRLIVLFVIQWIINISWNPLFFKFNLTLAALIVIVALTILIGYFLFGLLFQLKGKSVLLLPYFFWLVIASSLNAYIYIKN